MIGFTPTTIVAPYWGWNAFTPALPDFYWNVYSAEERIKKICCELHKLCEYSNMLADNINLDHELIDELQQAFTKFMESGFDDYYKSQVFAWIDSHLTDIISNIVGHVYFGLTSDGRFCAYIPTSWRDIIFDTGAVYGRSDYGRLILKMNVDSPDAIDNTYSYSLNASPTDFESLIRDLEVTTRRGDASYNALFTNLDVEVPNGNF